MHWLRTTNCLWMLCLWQGLAAQGKTTITITQREEKLIKSDAIAKLTAFAGLLNYISQEEQSPDDLRNLIQQNYSNPSVRKFYDANAIVVNDLEDPDAQRAVLDLKVSDYLTDVNIFFNKDPDKEVVAFSNLRTSNIKMADHLYIKVYYDSQFTRKSLKAERILPAQKKVATLRVVQTDKGWKSFIETIGLYDPAGDVNPNLNDIAIASDPVVNTDHYRALFTQRYNYLFPLNAGRKLLPKGFDDIGQDSVYLVFLNYSKELGTDDFTVNISGPGLVRRFAQDVWPDSAKVFSDFIRAESDAINANPADNVTRALGYFRTKEEAASAMSTVTTGLQGLKVEVHAVPYKRPGATQAAVNWNN